MMSSASIATEKAPAAIGPYSQGIKANGMVFVSGQLPVDPATGELLTEIAAATRQSLTNLAAVLAAGGCAMDQVVKTTVFLSDLKDFVAMNEVWDKWFEGVQPPARACGESALARPELLVEMIAIAAE